MDCITYRVKEQFIFQVAMVYKGTNFIIDVSSLKIYYIKYTCKIATNLVELYLFNRSLPLVSGRYYSTFNVDF